ncbi:multidrug efflux SMR transporter [Sporosarcina sp. Te-1]|uniref:DMT family transporter n=1 Tax=Sporosarcina sp. Te-1 TaxID=2818390 RepID=UPI001A9DBC65|nr:multidrug efflux SMR transporter [Sporosarcina sp. Te-1]QTD41103.1 multidrug efflux SMR transporter [Sporosarcina sp. Te-1]
MAWIYLSMAILFEIIGTLSMKMSEGFTKGVPSIFMIVFYILAFASLNFSLKTIPVSIAYAIWSGIGTAAIAVLGYYFFKETLTVTKVIAIGLIIAGVVLLNSGDHFVLKAQSGESSSSHEMEG